MKIAAPFSIARDFQAPLDLLWAVQTEPDHLAKWYSPPGYQTIHTHQDFRAGGHYHYGLKGPDGAEMWGKQSYVEITPKTRIVLLQAFSNPAGDIAAHPMAPTWPRQMLATNVFKSTGPMTSRLTVTWEPWQADQMAHDTFDAARDGMTQGFDGTFAMLDAYLAHL